MVNQVVTVMNTSCPCYQTAIDNLGGYKLNSKTSLKRPLKEDQKLVFMTGQKYCRMLQGWSIL